MTEFGGKLNRISQINHYTGGDRCQYQCGDIAAFVVKGSSGEGTVSFVGCLDCLNSASIHPIKNGWVDERDNAEKRRHA